MFYSKLILVAMAAAIFIGCGDIKDDTDAPDGDGTPICAPLTRQIVCPAGFPPGQHVCQDVSGAPVSGCELSPGIACTPACRRDQ